MSKKAKIGIICAAIALIAAIGTVVVVIAQKNKPKIQNKSIISYFCSKHNTYSKFRYPYL